LSSLIFVLIEYFQSLCRRSYILLSIKEGKTLRQHAAMLIWLWRSILHHRYKYDWKKNFISC